MYVCCSYVIAVIKIYLRFELDLYPGICLGEEGDELGSQWCSEVSNV